jgi:hypothetical protein
MAKNGAVRWILEPDDINVRKQKVVAQHGNEVYTQNLCHHHGNKFVIAVAIRRLRGNIGKILWVQRDNKRPPRKTKVRIETKKSSSDTQQRQLDPHA